MKVLSFFSLERLPDTARLVVEEAVAQIQHWDTVGMIVPAVSTDDVQVRFANLIP